MTTAVEYFVRHYTLVLDNDQNLYNAYRAAIREVTLDSDITVPQYRAMSAEDRATQLASDIGEKVLDLIGEWYLNAIKGNEDTAGGMLIQEIMINSDSEIAWQLGKYFLPEDSEAESFFDYDEPTDDESEE